MSGNPGVSPSRRPSERYFPRSTACPHRGMHTHQNAHQGEPVCTHTLILLDSSRGNQYVLSSKSTHTHRLGFLSGNLCVKSSDKSRANPREKFLLTNLVTNPSGEFQVTNQVTKSPSGNQVRESQSERGKYR